MASIAVAPAAWCFFLGLIAGAAIFYWKQMVTQIPLWASERLLIVYSKLDYTVEILPRMSVSARADAVLEKLKIRGSGPVRG